MARTFRTRLALAGGLALVVLAAGGCMGGRYKDDGGRLGAVRNSPAPELWTYDQRGEDMTNGIAHTWDLNLRGALDDLNRAMLNNTPSRLTRLPINH